jgi:hypothetical protein
MADRTTDFHQHARKILPVDQMMVARHSSFGMAVGAERTNSQPAIDTPTTTHNHKT